MDLQQVSWLCFKYLNSKAEKHRELKLSKPTVSITSWVSKIRFSRERVFDFIGQDLKLFLSEKMTFEAHKAIYSVDRKVKHVLVFTINHS